MELRRWIRGIAMALAMLVAIELGLRLLGLGGGASVTPRFLNPEGDWAAAGVYYERDPDLFWRLPKSRSIVGGWYRTNADGFRGPVAGPRRRDVPRVVLFGDSVTFGLGVDFEETYAAILERMLEARLGRDVEVLERAVPGYSSLQIARLALRDVPALAPDLVVVLAGSFNDQAPSCGVDDATADRIARARPGPIRRLAIWGAMRRALGRDRAPACPPLATSPPPPGAKPPRMRVAPRDFDANVRSVVETAGRAHAAALVVVPPLSEKMAALQPWARRYRDVARHVGGCRALEADRIFRSRDVPLFQADELHPNREGHLALATALADRITRDETIGAPIHEDALPEAVRAAREWARAADLVESSGDVAAALRLLERGGLAPRTKLAVARTLLRHDRASDAERLLRGIVRSNAGLVEAHQLLAECAAARGDRTLALRELETGVRLDRGWIHGRVLLARSLHALGRDAEARKEVARGLSIAPEDPDLVRLARTLER